MLKNSYLCLLNNTDTFPYPSASGVVICWKIRIFAYWTTPIFASSHIRYGLWFAEKFVSLLIEQHPLLYARAALFRCDLLKNSYLCLLNNTHRMITPFLSIVVICWKIRIFAYWTTPLETDIRIKLKLWFAEKFVSLLIEQHLPESREPRFFCCDLLKNSYLCLLNNTNIKSDIGTSMLWFAEKFVSLLIEQHRYENIDGTQKRCDLLKNSYLCLLNNTASWQQLT